MRKFNINDYMYIQITDFGWGHLIKTVGKDYIKHCIESKSIVINNEVWYKLQCHEVFDLFIVNMVTNNMFNNNVMFDNEDLQLI